MITRGAYLAAYRGALPRAASEEASNHLLAGLESAARLTTWIGRIEVNMLARMEPGSDSAQAASPSTADAPIATSKSSTSLGFRIGVAWQ